MSLELFDLTGRIALVTGSSRGLGYAIAEGLGTAGARIILNGLDENRLANAVEKMTGHGIETCGYAFNVSDPVQVKDKIDAVHNEVGPIDILVNNAGVQIRGALEDYSENDWDTLMDTNLKGVFVVTRCVVKSMIERKSGKIINIGSVQCELSRPTIGPYAASKGGVKMLTRAMATEWGKHNIQTNCIAPGYFITDLTKELVADETFNEWLCNRTPANRWGVPSDLVGAAVFLASKASDYVNGHLLNVDGGLQACV